MLKWFASTSLFQPDMIIFTEMLLVTLLHLFDFTFKIISIFMYRTYFSYTFRGYNDHISINNLCLRINNFWMVLLDMTAIMRIPCQSLVLSIFLDVTDLFVNKCCVACNKFYNALRGILYSLNNYMASNSSPSLHIPIGQNFPFLVFRNKSLDIGQCYTVGHWLKFWTWLSAFNEYVTWKFKMCSVEKRTLFPTSTQILESILCFLTK